MRGNGRKKKKKKWKKGAAHQVLRLPTPTPNARCLNKLWNVAGSRLVRGKSVWDPSARSRFSCLITRVSSHTARVENGPEAAGNRPRLFAFITVGPSGSLRIFSPAFRTADFDLFALSSFCALTLKGSNLLDSARTDPDRKGRAAFVFDSVLSGVDDRCRRS